jgi:hypothetical protein
MNPLRGLGFRFQTGPTFCALAVAFLTTSADVVAQESSFHGFAQVNYALRVARPPDKPGDAGRRDFILGDERVQIELSRTAGRAAFSARSDLFHDALSGSAGVEVREGYLTLSGGWLDLRVGRQVVTWGVGDLVFINDVFPKDWTALLSGRPLEYLKVGADALNLNVYSPFASAQVVLIPFFEPDRLPGGDRLIAFDPFPPARLRETVEPEPEARNAEIALRLSRRVAGFDLSVHAYRGFWRSPPGMRFDPLNGVATTFFPALSTYGVSAQGGLLSGVLSAEGGYYDSRRDRSGRDPSVENPQARFLAGYQRAFGGDLTVGVQYDGERTLKHGAYIRSLPPGLPARRKTRHSVTLRLTQLLKYQTLRLSLFAWASPNDRDYYVTPEVRYSLSDEVWIAGGVNVFGGKKGHTFFGQFDRNDNVYITMRYSF